MRDVSADDPTGGPLALIVGGMTPHLGTAIASLLALVTLTACGGSGGEGDGSKKAVKASEPKASMTEICPRVETVLTQDAHAAPNVRQLRKLQAHLGPIVATADLESRNALSLLTQGIDDGIAVYDDPTVILPALDAEAALDGGILAFSKRCKAARSSALQ